MNHPDADQQLPTDAYAPIIPRLGRIIPAAAATVVMLAVMVAALAMPGREPGHQGGWNLADRLMLVSFGALIAWFLMRYALIRATLSTDGMVVRNLFITRSLAWGQMRGIRFSTGDPWAYLELTDEDVVAVMAIQSADGAVAREHAQRVATVHAHHAGTAATPHPDE